MRCRPSPDGTVKIRKAAAATTAAITGFFFRHHVAAQDRRDSFSGNPADGFLQPFTPNGGSARSFRTGSDRIGSDPAGLFQPIADMFKLSAERRFHAAAREHILLLARAVSGR